MHLIGLPDGHYKWDSQVIVKTGDRLYLENTDTLAGAAKNIGTMIICRLIDGIAFSAPMTLIGGGR